jgi:hypothetical protein
MPGELCRQCRTELCGTPPGPNNFLLQYQKLQKEKQTNNNTRQQWMKTWTLMEHCAHIIVQYPELVLALVDVFPESHPPWHAMLRAWYMVKKKKARVTKTPQQKLLKLLNIEFASIVLKDVYTTA